MQQESTAPHLAGGRSGSPTLTTLPIDRIAPNPLQPRKVFDDEKLQELAASIREHGIVQPVIVSRNHDGYRLVVGERRWRASRLAGLTHIPAVVHEYDQAEAIEVALVENIQRSDLNPIEEAQAMQFLLKEHGMTQEALAQRLSRSRPAVSNMLRLLQLPLEIQRDVISGQLSAGHARALLGLEDETLRMKVWNRIREADLSVRQTEELVRRLQQGPTQPRQLKLQPELAEVEEDLTRWLQTAVKIKATSRDRGRIEVSYASSDELDRLLEAFSRIGRNRPAPRDVGLDLL
ncbi:MAG: ParB/RepB/Spo0J family partition protein [Candidatus Xenobia bacterium]